jgi:hypothetical protein
VDTAGSVWREHREKWIRKIVMCKKRRIKQLRRELKHMWRKNRREEIYFAGKYKVSSTVAEEHIPDGD